MTFLRVSAFVLAAAGLAFAAARAQAADIGVTVDPMVLEFSVPYGGEEHASVTVTNAGSAMERISVRPIDFKTSVDGSVILTASAHSTSAHSLTRYLKLSPASFTIAAGETRTVTISLQMPPHAAIEQKALWGGFLFQASSTSPRVEPIVPGATILVYDTSSTVVPHLSMRSFYERNRNGHAEFRASIVNDSETYARPLSTLVLEQRGKTILTTAVPMNTLFPQDSRIVTVAVPGIPAGWYDAHFVITYGDGSVVDGAKHVRIP